MSDSRVVSVILIHWGSWFYSKEWVWNGTALGK